MLKTKNKLLLAATLIGSVGYGVNAYSQSYMCMPCPRDLGSDGKSINCIPPNELSYEKTAFIKKETAETSSLNLEPGCYKFEISGGGGGGGGDRCGDEAGGGGGSGYRKTGYHCVKEFEETISYTIGAGGSGGRPGWCGRDYSGGCDGNGFDGGTTSLTSLFFSISAAGGGGGNAGGGNLKWGYGGPGQENGGQGHNPNPAGAGGGTYGGGPMTSGRLGGGGGGCQTCNCWSAGNGGSGYIYIYKSI